MLTYWAAFVLAASGAMVKLRVSSASWLLLSALLCAFIGLRFQVGGDWSTYVSIFYRAGNVAFVELFAFSDPAYYLLNWVVAQLGAGVWLVNLFSGAVFSTGLILFVRRLPAPMLAVTVAIPYMVIVLAMGYTRQAVAFGFMLCGLTYLLDRRIVGFMLLLAIAATFHKSAVILAPLAALASTRNRVWTSLWVGIVGGLLYWLFLAERISGLWQNYVIAEYSQASEGGPIRVAMNVVPAALFLLYRDRFRMAAEEHKLWFWMSAFSIICLPLVFQAPTAVDRVALYFMPIQLVVFSYLPQLVRGNSRFMARGAIIAFYALVQFVWLNYAAHSNAWLPYRFWPMVSG
ncbi:EpsG family protein [Endozoicomonas sp. G2_2]|uniref:EpsG family protein n=1 Tax=Endozoicomonas sp. G2_2 TaxID=2821092 RepID=UPI001ADC9025|nr:EpsG family protein [Endozoicomonas sp. G2_2]MBO9470136.1 EpsG family protein [Endozoicomonas sp. G2_2]